MADASLAPGLTPERFEELAMFALPVLGGPDTGATASQRLLGVAQWTLGRRREGTQP